MDNLITIALIIFIATFIFITIIAVHIFIKKLDQQDRLLDITKFEVNTRNPVDNTIPSALNEFINDCFMDYQLMVLLPKNEMYITSEREQEIISDLLMKVSERISPNFMEKLSQYYNIESIDKVIADKVYIIVLNYCVQTNSIITPDADDKK